MKFMLLTTASGNDNMSINLDNVAYFIYDKDNKHNKEGEIKGYTNAKYVTYAKLVNGDFIEMYHNSTFTSTFDKINSGITNDEELFKVKVSSFKYAT